MSFDNFEALKLGFMNYLQEKIDSEKNESEVEAFQNSEVSIFMFSDEFKDYLIDEVGADISIFSKSVNEIMSMDFENGQFVEYQDENTTNNNNGSDFMIKMLNEAFGNKQIISALDSNKDGELDKSEATSFLEGLKNNQGQLSFDDLTKASNSFFKVENNDELSEEESDDVQNGEKNNYSEEVNALLEKAYENQTLIKAFDEDGDGSLSDEEKAKFEEYAKSFSEDGTELTEDAIKTAFGNIIAGKYNLENPEEIVENDTELEPIETENAVEEAPSVNKPSSTSGSNGGGKTPSAPSSNTPASISSETPKSIENMSLSELQSEKSTQETKVQSAKEEVNKVHSGDNEAVKEAQTNVDSAKEAYDLAVESDTLISDELKDKRSTNLSAITAQEGVINQVNIDINNKTSEISNQESIVASDNSNISSIEASLTELRNQTTDDPEKQAEIDSKIAKAEAALQTAKDKLITDEATLQTLKNEKIELEENLETQKGTLKELETEKSGIEAEIAANCAPETKTAMEAYNEAKANLEVVKASELQKAQSTLATEQAELDKINNQINIKQSEETQKEYSVSDYNFDFEINLSDRQQAEMDAFLKNWEENQDKYLEVEERTGIKAELVAAIHWREGSGNFDTYLHNGEKLGQTTTKVPKGIYFENWTDAAIDALSNHGGGPEAVANGTLEEFYEYAERYNGTGYRKHGVNSPYVWAGTDKYDKGKYVADGQYDANYVDQQLGVAVMLEALLA